jgi:IS30 family transposase
MSSRNDEETIQRLTSIFAALPAIARLSITFGNGSEFAESDVRTFPR